MDHETRVTGGALALIVVGTALLLSGVGLHGLGMLRWVGGAIVLLGTFWLAAHVAGLEGEAH